jgi:hypothetical protein
MPVRTRRCLELYAGLEGWTSARDEFPNWEFVTTDYDEQFPVTFHADIFDLTVEWILETYGWFDVILASPPCEKFSVASLSKYWWVVDDCVNCRQPVRLVKRTHGRGGTTTWEHTTDAGLACHEPRSTIKHEPRIEPKNDEARYYSDMVAHTMKLIRGLAPKFWVMENPSGMMKRLPILTDDPEVERREISYCRYGMTYMKPTTLWGGFPPSLKLHEVCKTRKSKKYPLAGQEVIDPDSGWTYITDEHGEPCHEKAERGARTGIQRITSYAEKSLVPRDLSYAVLEAAEHDLKQKTRRVLRRVS